MPESPVAAAAATTHLPLSGLVVLDLTLARAGPTCVRHLADWGADVIRIEAPSKGGGESFGGARHDSDFQNLHRNKRQISLNLKEPEGHAAFMKLVAKADVIVENMRATVKHRLHIAYDDVKAVNPRIVYGSISGFGQDGPYGKRGGVDQIAQGMGGLMSITGEPGRGPMRVGIPVTDLTAGNLLALGIMMALFDRERTGVGRWVTTSLLESMIFMLDLQASRWTINHEVPPQAGNDHPTNIPMGVFPASDGQINIAAAGGRIFESFCKVLGHPEWMERPEWSTPKGRSADRKAINEAISAITATKPCNYWIELLEEAGIPCGPIYSIDQVFADPQVKHLKMTRTMKNPKLGDKEVVASAINISGYDKDIRIPVPEADQDTDEVLAGIGYTKEQLAEMRGKGVI